MVSPVLWLVVQVAVVRCQDYVRTGGLEEWGSGGEEWGEARGEARDYRGEGRQEGRDFRGEESVEGRGYMEEWEEGSNNSLREGREHGCEAGVENSGRYPCPR